MRPRKIEAWSRAPELAKKGYTVCAGAREMGVNHATAIYIAKQLGFEWAPSLKGRYARRREPDERVERMMRLACK